MNRIIHQLYNDGKITLEDCQQLLDQLSKSKEKRRYY